MSIICKPAHQRECWFSAVLVRCSHSVEKTRDGQPRCWVGLYYKSSLAPWPESSCGLTSKLHLDLTPLQRLPLSLSAPSTRLSWEDHSRQNGHSHRRPLDAGYPSPNFPRYRPATMGVSQLDWECQILPTDHERFSYSSLTWYFQMGLSREPSSFLPAPIPER
jgi:hypothetical protein